MDSGKELVHLARLVVSKKYEDASSLAKRAMRGVVRERPDLASDANAILNEIASVQLVRSQQVKQQPLPVDMDSRLELLRRDNSPLIQDNLVWPAQVADELRATIEERAKSDELLDVGLFPTRSLLFVGEPGVGKTLAARWLAVQLNRPLLTLDLSAVMSSFLGRTGGNIRVVLDYARKSPCVLLLDEFDAIAKRRDDTGEIGELKRLVTVLLQEVDDWPSDGLLIAATNHPELLDPAVWRRFDRVVNFPLPSFSELRHTIGSLFGEEIGVDEQGQIDALACAFIGKSFAEVTRQINSSRKMAVVRNQDIKYVFEELLTQHLEKSDRKKKIELALQLAKMGYSQRKIQSLTGISRDTVRNHSRKSKDLDASPNSKDE